MSENMHFVTGGISFYGYHSTFAPKFQQAERRNGGGAAASRRRVMAVLSFRLIGPDCSCCLVAAHLPTAGGPLN
jgi:hypothetical protein